MKFISKINTTTKILILVIYTFALAAIAGAVVIKTSNKVVFTEYTDKPYDENLEVAVSLLERRTRSDEKKETSREEAKWDVRVHLNALDTSKKIKNVGVYLTLKTHNERTFIKNKQELKK